MSKADIEYNKVVSRILNEGIWDKDQNVRTRWADGSPAYTKSVISAQMHFDNTEPALLTSKRVAWKTAIKEILAFWQQKTNRFEDFHSQGIKIWDEWEIQEGEWKNTIGPAYGYQMGLPVRELNGTKVDQVDYLLHQLKYNPASRRHVTSLWKIDDLDEMALNPCVWHTQWLVKGGALHLIVGQRSGDISLGVPFNIFQYQVLQMMVAQALDYELGTLTFNINDAHIYERHIEGMKEQLESETFDAPLLKVNPDIENFYDFTIDDFELTDYVHGPKRSFEVAI